MGILKFSPSSKIRKGAEQGWSLVNTLVTVILTLIIGTVAVSLIVSAQRGSNQFTDTVMTESELNNAMSTMTRSITTAEDVLIADDNLLKVRTVENNKKADMTFFAWSPEKWDSVKPYLTGENASGSDLAKSDLPAFPAVVSATSLYNNDGETSGKPEVRVLVNGYIQENDNNLFTYFDQSDDALPTVMLGDETNAIERIQIHLKATVEGRDAPMELATSVVPRIAGDANVTGPDGNPTNEVPQAVNLSGSLPPRTQESTLTWNAVDGADAYVLYRGNALQESNPKMLATTTATSWKDSDDIRWGETYTYYVIATNYAGVSASSNVVALTATPPAPVLEGEINEEFQNVITWESTNGAVGYRLLKDGKEWETVNGHGNTTITDTDVIAGDKHTYKAVAFNGNGTGKGNTLGNGDSHWSNEISLVANPRPPVLSGEVDKGDRILSWTSTPGAEAYELKRIEPSGKSFGLQVPRTYTDKDVIKTQNDFKYQVRSKNGNGWSKWSNIVTLNPIPDPVDPRTSDWTTNQKTYDGKNSTSWAHKNDKKATHYDYKKNNESWQNVGYTTNRGDSSPGRDSKNTYHVRACNYIGCSESRSDVGLQAPGPFTVTRTSENPRTGYHSTRNDVNKNLSVQNATFSWNSSAGADNYAYKGVGSSGSTGKTNFKASGFTPGSKHDIKVTAKGNTSGLSRESVLKWQSAPAQPHNVRFRMQYKGASDGDTRLRFWADGVNYKASTGHYNTVQIRYGISSRSGSGGNWKFSQDSNWTTWNKAVNTRSFVKKHTSAANAKAGIAWVRTYKSVASGYLGSVHSQTSEPKTSHSSFVGGYAGLYGGNTVGNGNPWTSYNSNGAAKTVSGWTDISYSNRNYPVNAAAGNKNNWYQISSR